MVMPEALHLHKLRFRPCTSWHFPGSLSMPLDRLKAPLDGVHAGCPYTPKTATVLAKRHANPTCIKAAATATCTLTNRIHILYVQLYTPKCLCKLDSRLVNKTRRQ